MDNNAFPATSRIIVRPWDDPVVDERGFDPRSAYVERFWLGILGPTATWIVRRFAEEFDRSPDGFGVDLVDAATSMGVSYAKGASSPFGRALRRCVMFGLAAPTADGFAVRRRLPQVPRRHLSRLPDDLVVEHADWVRAHTELDRRDLEQHLISAGIPPRAAVSATDAALLAS